MPRRTSDPKRDERISMEIIVDAYGEEEVMLGWYYYLEEKLEFPFKARCTKKIITSPLEVGRTVSVVGMASEKVCIDQDQIIVLVKYDRKNLGIPLDQLEPDDTDHDERTQAFEDWHYWRGNQTFSISRLIRLCLSTTGPSSRVVSLPSSTTT